MKYFYAYESRHGQEQKLFLSMPLNIDSFINMYYSVFGISKRIKSSYSGITVI